MYRRGSCRSAVGTVNNAMAIARYFQPPAGGRAPCSRVLPNPNRVRAPVTLKADDSFKIDWPAKNSSWSIKTPNTPMVPLCTEFLYCFLLLFIY